MIRVVAGRMMIIFFTRGSIAVVTVMIEKVDLFLKFGIILTFVFVCERSLDRGAREVL